MDTRGESESGWGEKRVPVGVVPAVAGPIQTRGVGWLLGTFGLTRGATLLVLLGLAEVYLLVTRTAHGRSGG